MAQALSILMGDYSLQRKTESYVNGELVQTFTAAEAIHCAVLPLSGKELRTLPEGEYDTEDKSIVTNGTVDLSLGDRITAFSTVYEIRRKTDVSDLVNLKTYTAKKV